jgi:NAD(P)-dependent dehydrogenase (short-subunit alcohol dehydrogenase family)
MAIMTARRPPLQAPSPPLHRELLAGHVAVVTGGGGGIGRGVSRRLAAAGATVVVNDIDRGLLDEVVADIEATGSPAVAVPGDIRRPDTVTTLAEAAAAVAGGRIDVLVNNVGDYRPNGRFLKTGPDDWAALYALNFEHVLRCTRAIAPAMVERGGREHRQRLHRRGLPRHPGQRRLFCLQRRRQRLHPHDDEARGVDVEVAEKVPEW